MEEKKGGFFKTFDNLVGHLENIGVGLTFVAIVILVTVCVFYRYVLKSGFMWSAEVQEVLVVAMAMFGCAKATRESGHTELTALTKMFPRRGRIVIRTITSVLTVIFLAVFFWTSLKYTLASGKLKTIMLRIPYKYFYMWLPIGMGFNLYEFIKRIPDRIKNDPPEEV